MKSFLILLLSFVLSVSAYSQNFKWIELIPPGSTTIPTNNGTIRFNHTTGRFEFRQGGSWINPVLNPMTAAGDLIYGGASGVPTRLAAGTNGHVLTLSGGNPVWSESIIGWPLSGSESLTGNVDIDTELFNLNILGNSDSLRFFIDHDGSFWDVNTIGIAAGDPTLNNTYTNITSTKGWNGSDYAFNSLFSNGTFGSAAIETYASELAAEIRMRAPSVIMPQSINFAVQGAGNDLTFSSNNNVYIQPTGDFGVTANVVSVYTNSDQNYIFESPGVFTVESGNGSGWTMSQSSGVFTGKQTFTPSTSAGLNIGSSAGDPATTVNYDVWGNSSIPALRAKINNNAVYMITSITGLTSTRVPFAAGGGSAAYTLIDDSGFTFNTTGDVLTVGRLVTLSTSTLPGLNIGSFAGNPSTLVNGDVWYNSTSNQFMLRWNGATIQMGDLTGSLSSGRVAFATGTRTLTDDADLTFSGSTTTATNLTIGGGTLTYNTGSNTAYDKTITASGTTGAQTINKLVGTVNFAAAASSLVVTNSLVTANSVVICVVRTNDGTALIKNVVPTSGSFTITLNAAATAETSVGFLVVN